MTHMPPGHIILIIGGGFCGLMLAAHLAEHGLNSVIVEADRAGGTAYATRDPAHLLNVPAARMSAWPDRPDDLIDFLGDAAPTDFIPRARYGEYLAAIRARLMAQGRLSWIKGRAVAAAFADGQWRVKLDDGSVLMAGALALAPGNAAPAPPPGWPDDARALNDPWAPAAQAALMTLAGTDRPVMAIGTGLTMVDMMLTLDRLGHRGPLIALSRHGRLPQAHAPHPPLTLAAADLPPPQVRAGLRWLRSIAKAHDWRAGIDALRPHSAHYWQALGPTEQARFLRHARHLWDYHRHRMAPDVAARVARRQRRGALRVVAGRLLGADPQGGGLRVRWRPRGHAAQACVDTDAALLINCTGPAAPAADPLLKAMIGDGLLTPDAHGLGVMVDRDGRVPGQDGLYALGSLGKGCWWEITAVPDLRQQVTAAAASFADRLASR